MARIRFGDLYQRFGWWFAGVAVQVAKQPFAVALRVFRQVLDEFADLLSCRLFEFIDFTEIGGVGLHQTSLQLVLPNEEAQAVAERMFPTVVVINVTGWRPALSRWRKRTRKGSEFLYRADTDTVSFPQGAIDGACLGYTKFCAPDPW